MSSTLASFLPTLEHNKKKQLSAHDNLFRHSQVRFRVMLNGWEDIEARRFIGHYHRGLEPDGTRWPAELREALLSFLTRHEWCLSPPATGKDSSDGSFFRDALSFWRQARTMGFVEGGVLHDERLACLLLHE